MSSKIELRKKINEILGEEGLLVFFLGFVVCFFFFFLRQRTS